MNTKAIYILVAAVIVIAVGWWFWMNQPVSNQPASGTAQEQGQENVSAGSDATEAIDQDLNSITIEDPDFESIDGDLNSL